MKGARNAKGDRSGEQPQNLINNARNLDTAVPMARPTQTMVDQETWPARSATAPRFSPGKTPTPAAESSFTASTTKPKKVESHATRRRVAPSFGGGCDTTDLLVGVWTERRSVTA
jgi:hypothetical protein